MSEVVEHLPGEPVREAPRGPRLALGIGLRALRIGLVGALTSGLWPLYLVGLLVWGRPPIVPRLAQIWRYLGLIATVRPPPPGLSTAARLVLALSVARIVVNTPVWALMWWLDEVLYGRALAPLEAPLIEIST
jgi:hypothetical protein